MRSNFFGSHMLVFVAGVPLLDIDLGDQEHIDECPDESQNAAPNNDKEFCIESKWTATGATCCCLEMSLEVMSSNDHLVVETMNLYTGPRINSIK